MKAVRLIFLLLFFSGTSTFLWGQEQQSSRTRRETIRVIDTASGYESTVILQSIPGKNRKNFFIHYNSLEKINDYEIRYLTEKGKWKMFRKADIRDFQVTGDAFYSCERSLAIELPDKGPFQVTYETSSSDLILQSNLPFYDRFPVDTFFYEIFIPTGYNLHTRLQYPEMLNFYQVDSTSGKRGMTYTFTGVPKNQGGTNFEPENDTREHRCMVLTAIVPKAFAGNETRYFNDWMLNKLRSKTQLNDTSQRLLDSIAGNSGDKDSITCALFNYIKDHIKYISVEIGYGAFVPHDVNKTLVSRQGDCKDMASLLCEALRSKGVDAWLAVAATLSHKCDMTFPSLSAGNHMICVVKRNGTWLFLDPTNKSGSCWLTSEGIESRTILVLGPEGGTYVTIPPNDPQKNREHIRMTLVLNNDNLTGTMRYTAFGAAMQQLTSHYSYAPKSEWSAISRDFLSALMAGVSFRSAVIARTSDSLVIDMQIVLSTTVVTRNGKTTYLSLGFLPQPMDFINGNDLTRDIILGHTVLRDVEIRIETDTNIQTVTRRPLKFDEGGFLYKISSDATGKVLSVRSEFRCDNIIIRDDQLAVYQKFSSFVSTSHNYAVSFK